MLTETQKETLSTLAATLVGTPYVYGTSPEKAPHEFDCSSFTQYLYKQIGIQLPRSTILQAADIQGQEIIPLEDYSNLETGDLLFMRGPQGHYNDNLFPNREMYIGHMVMYMGNGKVIHARESIGSVEHQPLKELVSLPKMGIVLIKRFGNPEVVKG
jgi:cell wall-associated NlpC family hydrolase